MNAGAFAATMVTAVLALGVIPGWVAKTRRVLFASDFALVIGPGLLFYVFGYVFNPELRVGFGLIVYPFVTLVVSVVLLYLRVFLLDRMSERPLQNSLLLAVSLCALAAIAGAVTPPLYE